MKIIDPITLRLQIDNYFSQVKDGGKFNVGETEYTETHPTITGLALFLGFSSTNYFKTLHEDPELAEIIEYGLLRVENQYEKLLQNGVTNAKIALKRLGDWKEEPETQNVFNFAQFMKDLSDKDEINNNRIKNISEKE